LFKTPKTISNDEQNEGCPKTCTFKHSVDSVRPSGTLELDRSGEGSSGGDLVT
jgi:hypothetical protein